MEINDGTYTAFFNEVFIYDVDILEYLATNEDVEKAIERTPAFQNNEPHMLISYETLEN